MFAERLSKRWEDEQKDVRRTRRGGGGSTFPPAEVVEAVEVVESERPVRNSVSEGMLSAMVVI